MNEFVVRKKAIFILNEKFPFHLNISCVLPNFTFENVKWMNDFLIRKLTVVATLSLLALNRPFFSRLYEHFEGLYFKICCCNFNFIIRLIKIQFLFSSIFNIWYYKYYKSIWKWEYSIEILQLRTNNFFITIRYITKLKLISLEEWNKYKVLFLAYKY